MRMTSVLSDLFALWVSLNSLNDTAKNCAGYISDNAVYRIVFLSSDKHYLNILFLHFPSVSISRVSHLKNFGFVQWHQGELTLLASLYYYYYYLYFYIFIRRIWLTSLNAAGIGVLPSNFRIYSLFVVTRTNSPSARVVSAAILDCKAIDILQNAWINENRFCANLCHSLTNLSSRHVLPR
jgi:hypothetical protein